MAQVEELLIKLRSNGMIHSLQSLDFLRFNENEGDRSAKDALRLLQLREGDLS